MHVRVNSVERVQGGAPEVALGYSHGQIYELSLDFHSFPVGW